MRARGTLLALSGVAAIGLVACLGYGSPQDESGDNGISLPDRTDEEKRDATVTDKPAPTTPTPTPTPDSGTDSAMVDAAKKPLRAFVSSQIKNGNLGGVAGADQTCMQLATAQNLGGNWRAWISVNGTDAIDHITSTGPWQLVNGDVVADNKTTLASGSLKHLIDKDEKGATPPDAEDRAWTATGANGRYTGPDCAGWTSTGANGMVGEAKNGGANQWTALGSEPCSEVNRVYCFEL
jgi:hypothetical protein